ncbi:hypothetical protein [Haemophilus influenzae]|uniref:hypothetical protein n=1 Tax=Haemophilus influenzae TaxID=727 RepID=UPI000E590448|nr:hypothetical protein [Haemophilus influenzae]MCK9052882.1 hypothetical protein [Haemophilus influenzae]BBF06603.1 hypothetical protein CHBNIII7_04860 [Haemophilus influenzae]
MRIEFLDLIDSNESLASGLFTLSYLLEVAENAEEQGNVVGIYELVKLLAFAAQKQTKDMTFVFEYTEKENR